MYRCREIAVEHHAVIFTLGDKLHILRCKLSQRRREAAADILIGLAQCIDSQGYRIVLSGNFRVFALHSAYLRAEHQRIAHCGKSAAALGHQGGNAAAFRTRLGKLTAQLRGLIIAAGEVELRKRSALRLLLTAAHRCKGLGGLLLDTLSLRIVFVKLKEFVKARGNILLGLCSVL